MIFIFNTDRKKIKLNFISFNLRAQQYTNGTHLPEGKFKLFQNLRLYLEVVRRSKA